MEVLFIMPDRSIDPQKRYFGLDIHKHYFVVEAVNRDLETVYGPKQVSNEALEDWAKRVLTPQDELTLEMTTNAYLFYDTLAPYAHWVTVVHPPNVPEVTNARVKTDKKAAETLAKLLATGMLKGKEVWIPPHEVRDLRALVAHREEMVHLSTASKNRLHSLEHRKHLALPDNPFAPDQRTWWEKLELSTTEKLLVLSDLDTLDFAQKQVEQIEESLKQQSIRDERIPLLVQLPGVGVLTAMTILAAIGDISRFPNAKKLVGYAGLGTSVHDSGMTHTHGRITKAGRKDLRRAMVNAANNAIENHPYWKAQLDRLEPRLGRQKTVVAIARKLLVAVWHVLTQEVADRFSTPEALANRFMNYAYGVRVRNLPNKPSAPAFARTQLDRLGIGKDLQKIRHRSRAVQLPPSTLKE
jgi:transposase